MVSEALLCGLLAPLLLDRGASKRHGAGSRDRESRKYEVGPGEWRKDPGTRSTRHASSDITHFLSSYPTS